MNNGQCYFQQGNNREIRDTFTIVSQNLATNCCQPVSTCSSIDPQCTTLDNGCMTLNCPCSPGENCNNGTCGLYKFGENRS